MIKEYKNITERRAISFPAWSEKYLDKIEYFQFEEDFVEEGIRCIPMIVRFKMDAAGIKLKLTEWSKFSVSERTALALLPCDTAGEHRIYNSYLAGLIKIYTGNEPTVLPATTDAAWGNKDEIPLALQEALEKINARISLLQWKELTTLQRFALLKLSRPGHENRNLPIALKEFSIS